MIILAFERVELKDILRKDVLYSLSSIFITAAFLRFLQSMSPQCASRLEFLCIIHILVTFPGNKGCSVSCFYARCLGRYLKLPRFPQVEIYWCFEKYSQDHCQSRLVCYITPLLCPVCLFRSWEAEAMAIIPSTSERGSAVIYHGCCSLLGPKCAGSHHVHFSNASTLDWEFRLAYI